MADTQRVTVELMEPCEHLDGYCHVPQYYGCEVVPCADVIGHSSADVCACMPHNVLIGRDRFGVDVWHVLHQAWDGREPWKDGWQQ